MPVYNNPLGSLLSKQGQTYRNSFMPYTPPAMPNPSFNTNMQLAQFMQVQNPTPQSQVFIAYVTNMEEAKAQMVDAMNKYLFIDPDGRMYLKYMKDDGTSAFETYVRADNIAQKQAPSVDNLAERLAKLESLVGGQNAESSSDANDA